MKSEIYKTTKEMDLSGFNVQKGTMIYRLGPITNTGRVEYLDLTKLKIFTVSHYLDQEIREEDKIL